MAILEIKTPEDDVLRADTETVNKIRDAAVQQLIDDMVETMRDEEGVGLAAPQIGRSIKLAVIETLPDYDEDGEPIPDTRKLYAIVNPEVIWRSRKKTTGIEGCLSIPGYLGEVERPHAVIVRAWDRFGRKKRYRLKGWDARIFQHEIDHLNGVLFTDKLTAPENYWSEEEFEEKKKAEEAAEAAEAAQTA